MNQCCCLHCCKRKEDAATILTHADLFELTPSDITDVETNGDK